MDRRVVYYILSSSFFCTKNKGLLTRKSPIVLDFESDIDTEFTIVEINIDLSGVYIKVL